MTGHIGAVTVTLGALVDVLRTSEGCVALVKAPIAHQVVRVSEVGDAVLEALSDGPVTVEALTSALVQQFGPPPEGEARSHVEAVLADMSRLGLVAMAS